MFQAHTDEEHSEDPLKTSDIQDVDIDKIRCEETPFEKIKQAIGFNVMLTLEKGLIDSSDEKETALRSVLTAFREPQFIEEILPPSVENIKVAKPRGPRKIDVVSSIEYLNSLDEFLGEKKRKKLERESEAVVKLSSKLAKNIKKESEITVAAEKKKMRKENAENKVVQVERKKEEKFAAAQKKKDEKAKEVQRKKEEKLNVTQRKKEEKDAKRLTDANKTKPKVLKIKQENNQGQNLRSKKN